MNMAAMSRQKSICVSAAAVGDRVLARVRADAAPQQGIVRFAGPTEFGEGEWVGVELLAPEGKHDGTVMGLRYFQCKPSHGVFLRPQMVCLDEAASTDEPQSPASPYRRGQAVKYCSASAGKWVPCEVTAVRGDGAVRITLRGEDWLSPEEQVLKLRVADAGEAAKDPVSWAHGAASDDTESTAGLPAAEALQAELEAERADRRAERRELEDKLMESAHYGQLLLERNEALAREVRAVKEQLEQREKALTARSGLDAYEALDAAEGAALQLQERNGWLEEERRRLLGEVAQLRDQLREVPSEVHRPAGAGSDKRKEHDDSDDEDGLEVSGILTASSGRRRNSPVEHHSNVLEDECARLEAENRQLKAAVDQLRRVPTGAGEDTPRDGAEVGGVRSRQRLSSTEQAQQDEVKRAHRSRAVTWADAKGQDDPAPSDDDGENAGRKVVRWASATTTVGRSGEDRYRSEDKQGLQEVLEHSRQLQLQLDELQHKCEAATAEIAVLLERKITLEAQLRVAQDNAASLQLLVEQEWHQSEALRREVEHLTGLLEDQRNKRSVSLLTPHWSTQSIRLGDFRRPSAATASTSFADFRRPSMSAPGSRPRSRMTSPGPENLASILTRCNSVSSSNGAKSRSNSLDDMLQMASIPSERLVRPRDASLERGRGGWPGKPDATLAEAAECLSVEAFLQEACVVRSGSPTMTGTGSSPSLPRPLARPREPSYQASGGSTPRRQGSLARRPAPREGPPPMAEGIEGLGRRLTQLRALFAGAGPPGAGGPTERTPLRRWDTTPLRGPMS